MYLIINYPPDFQFSIYNYSLQIIPVFFVLLFVFLYFLFDVLFASRRRGLFAGFFAATYLLLRLSGLTHPFFLVMLIILFGCLELFFVKRK